MAPSTLEVEDHQRDAAFNKVLHGSSAKRRGGLAAMSAKDQKAQRAAVDEYFKHWDKKPSAEETDEIREVSLELNFSWEMFLTCHSRRVEKNTQLLRDSKHLRPVHVHAE